VRRVMGGRRDSVPSVKLGMSSVIGALAFAAVFVAAPTASALPTGSAGSEELRIGDAGYVEGNAGLDKCIWFSYPYDLRISNGTQRQVYVYSSTDCTGDPTATVPPGGGGTFFGGSVLAVK